MIVFDKYYEFQSILVTAQQERSPQIERQSFCFLDSKKVHFYEWEFLGSMGMALKMIEPQLKYCQNP